MMQERTILMEKTEGITTLTLNRPEKLNAYNGQMAQELEESLEALEKDRETRVLVITGAGRAFSAGGDVQDLFLKSIEAAKRGEAGPWPIQPSGTRAGHSIQMLRNLPMPIIAAINGPAVGFGATFPLACDIRIASEEAKMGFVFSRLGLILELGSTYFLPRLVGIAKACELAFTGKIIDAHEALRIGLVNQVVPAAQFREAVREMARGIAQGPPIALAMAKRGLYQGLNNDLPTQLAYEAFAIAACRQTQDHEEGVRAFLEKREPVFKGR